MATLLLKLSGSKTFNRTFFAPHLFVYNDMLLYRKRSFFKVNEITIAYSHIAEVNLLKGIFFARIEINTTAQKPIIIKYANKEQSVRAKKIIDQKIYSAHAKHKPENEPANVQNEVHGMEKSLNRLTELHNRGKINNKEHDSMRKKLLEQMS